MRDLINLVETQKLDELVNASDLEIYHWTSAENLRHILHNGLLRAGASTHELDGKTLHGVSLSRNAFFDISQTYAISGIKAWRLGFNLQKLKYDHRIIPIRDEPYRNMPRQGRGKTPDIFGSKYDLKIKAASSDEMEEFCIGDIYPIWTYLTSIAVEDRHIDIDYHPDETRSWEDEEFDNGVGGMSQEDQEMLFDILAGSVFGRPAFERAFHKEARHAIRLPKGVSFKVIDRQSHKIYSARDVFAPRLRIPVPNEPEHGNTDWPVSAMSHNREDRNQAFNQKTRSYQMDEGRFDDENSYEYGSKRTAEEYASHFWYHGSEADMEDFMLARVRNPSYAGLWFAEDPRLTGYYGPNQYKVKLHFKNPLIVSEDEYIGGKPHGPTFWARKAKDDGYDAVIIQDVIDGDTESTICCVFDPSKIQIIDKDLYVDESIKEEVRFPLAKGVLDRARGYYGAMICVMNPKDFLRLTTVSDVDMDHIIHRDEFAQSVAAYKAGDHPSYNKNQYGIPFLDVNIETGKIIGHEGRHRAAMVVREGGTKFPCVLVFKNPFIWQVTYTEEPYSKDGTDHDSFEEKEKIFKTEAEADTFEQNLRSLNDKFDHGVYYSGIRTQMLGGHTMKGSPRSNPGTWEYKPWQAEDMPSQLTGQYNSSIVVPTNKMQYGVVKGYHHYK